MTMATIEKVYVGNGWCYEGCQKCNKKMDSSQLPFICRGCGQHNKEAVTRWANHSIIHVVIYFIHNSFLNIHISF